MEGQETVILQVTVIWNVSPVIKITLRFPEIISKHQKPVYFNNFLVRYNQF